MPLLKAFKWFSSHLKSNSSSSILQDLACSHLSMSCLPLSNWHLWPSCSFFPHSLRTCPSLCLECLLPSSPVAFLCHIPCEMTSLSTARTLCLLSACPSQHLLRSTAFRRYSIRHLRMWVDKNIEKATCWGKKNPAQSSLEQVTPKSQLSISESNVVLLLLRELQRFYACVSRSSKRSNFLFRRVAVHRLRSKFTAFYRKMKGENHMKSSNGTLAATMSAR